MGWRIIYIQTYTLKATSISMTRLYLFVGYPLHKQKWERGVYTEHKSFRIVIIEQEK